MSKPPKTILSESTNRSTWIPVSTPPTTYSRVIVKTECDDIYDMVYLNKPRPGFYSVTDGLGLKLCPFRITRYIHWPNE